MNIHKLFTLFGAGVSFSADLDWDFIMEMVWKILRKKYKRSGGKEKFVKDWEKRHVEIWRKIKKGKGVFKKFKNSLARTVEVTTPEEPHKHIFKIFNKRNRVLCLFCLNWDNLFER